MFTGPKHSGGDIYELRVSSPPSSLEPCCPASPGTARVISPSPESWPCITSGPTPLGPRRWLKKTQQSAEQTNPSPCHQVMGHHGSRTADFKDSLPSHPHLLPFPPLLLYMHQMHALLHRLQVYVSMFIFPLSRPSTLGEPV